jgi:hypothetical protein
VELDLHKVLLVDVEQLVKVILVEVVDQMQMLEEVVEEKLLLDHLHLMLIMLVMVVMEFQYVQLIQEHL